MRDYTFRNFSCLHPRHVFGRTLESSRLEPTQRACCESPHVDSGVKLQGKSKKYLIFMIRIIASSTHDDTHNNHNIHDTHKNSRYMG